jgi:hypothetical protein
MTIGSNKIIIFYSFQVQWSEIQYTVTEGQDALNSITSGVVTVFCSAWYPRTPHILCRAVYCALTLVLGRSKIYKISYHSDTKYLSAQLRCIMSYARIAQAVQNTGWTIPGKATDVSLRTPNGSGAQPGSYLKATRCSIQGKAAVVWNWQFPTFSAEFKKQWSYTSTLTCACVAWKGTTVVLPCVRKLRC